MVLKRRGKRANQDLEITTSRFETPRSVRMSKRARLDDQEDLGIESRLARENRDLRERLDDRLDFGPRETPRNRFELQIPPRMEESDPLTKFFNDMRSEKSYLNRSIRDYSGSADEFES